MWDDGLDEPMSESDKLDMEVQREIMGEEKMERDRENGQEAVYLTPTLRRYISEKIIGDVNNPHTTNLERKGLFWYCLRLHLYDLAEQISLQYDLGVKVNNQ